MDIKKNPLYPLTLDARESNLPGNRIVTVFEITNENPKSKNNQSRFQMGDSKLD